MRKYGKLIYLSVCWILLLSYSNCGRVGFNANFGDGSSNFASMGKTACDGVLMQAYSNTYYPILSVACNQCHSTGHGSTDMETSFNGFMSKGVTLIDYKATHPHGDNGLDLTNQINSLKGDWNKGQSDYMTCLSSTGTTAPSVSGGAVKLNGKTIPMIADTIKNQNNWKTVTWDLDTDVPDSVKGKLNSTLSIQVRYALQGTAVAGFEFRNPMMALKTTKNYVAMAGLNVYTDDVYQSNVTTYITVSSKITSTTAVALAPGVSIALDYAPTVKDTSTIALEFQGISLIDPVTGAETPISGGSTVTTTSTLPPGPTTTTTLPAAVTFTKLNSTDATLGVFRKSCVSCHSAGNKAGGLDLTNYADSKLEAATIISRMNNTALPMPPQGVLPMADRNVVQSWINAGTPQ